MQATEAQILDASMLANSIEGAIHTLRDMLEVGHLTCHLMSLAPGPVNNPFVRTTYPAGWVSHYLLNNLVLIDPVLSHAASEDEPFFWDELVLTPPQRKMIAKAVEFGVGTCGYTVPYVDRVGRRSILTLNGSDALDAWRARIAPNAGLVLGMARDLHIKAIGEVFVEAEAGPSLSPRELECLRWTAVGKTYSEIAVILGLSEHTVRSYLKSLRLKLDAVSLAQAVGTAAGLGLVQPVN